MAHIRKVRQADTNAEIYATECIVCLKNFYIITVLLCIFLSDTLSKKYLFLSAI